MTDARVLLVQNFQGASKTSELHKRLDHVLCASTLEIVASSLHFRTLLHVCLQATLARYAIQFRGVFVVGQVQVPKIVEKAHCVFHFDYPASYNTAFDANTTRMDIYQIIMYGSPIIRCQIYLIGMAVGWLLQHVQRVKIHWVANLSIWIVVLSMLSAVTFGLYSEGTGTALPLFWKQRKHFCRCFIS